MYGGATSPGCIPPHEPGIGPRINDDGGREEPRHFPSPCMDRHEHPLVLFLHILINIGYSKSQDSSYLAVPALIIN